MTFKGKAPGPGSGEMSKRTEALRPAIDLSPKEITEVRRMRRSGLDVDLIASTLSKPLEEVEKALVQMRMPRPETSRGTLNITLAAHRLVMRERRGDEPLWQTFDRMVDELLTSRALQASRGEVKPAVSSGTARRPGAAVGRELPLLAGLLDQSVPPRG